MSLDRYRLRRHYRLFRQKGYIFLQKEQQKGRGIFTLPRPFAVRGAPLRLGNFYLFSSLLFSSLHAPPQELHEPEQPEHPPEQPMHFLPLFLALYT
jgi:hypothetical protein